MNTGVIKEIKQDISDSTFQIKISLDLKTTIEEDGNKTVYNIYLFENNNKLCSNIFQEDTWIKVNKCCVLYELLNKKCEFELNFDSSPISLKSITVKANQNG